VSPLTIEMLIWFCTRAPVEGNGFPNIGLGPQCLIVNQFMDEEIIEIPDGMEGRGLFTATDKGRAWLEMICATPMPVQQWIDPRAPSGSEQR
jgi:hypothetical protein